MKKILPVIFAIFLLFTIVTPRAFAETTAECQAKNHAIKNADGTSTYVEYMPSDFGCVPNDPIAFAEQYYGIGLSVIGGVSMIFIIIGGYTFMTSQGNPTQINKAKSYIFYAIAGLLLAVFGYLFIQVVVVDILHIPGFS